MIVTALRPYRVQDGDVNNNVGHLLHMLQSDRYGPSIRHQWDSQAASYMCTTPLYIYPTNDKPHTISSILRKW
jgi:hypothetical protein